MPEILTDEQAAAIWSGETTSILGLAKTPEVVAQEAKVKADADAKAKIDAEAAVKAKVDAEAKASAATTVNVVDDKDLNNMFGDKDEDDTTNTDAGASTTDTKKGRKPTDLVQATNQLIEEGVLLAAEDDKGVAIEIKTIEDAKNVIKANLDYKEKQSNDGWKDDYKKSFSPQVQAVLHYAEQGAQSATEIAQLLGAIQQVEDAVELDPKTPAGHEQIVRQTLKAKGFKDTYIDKQVNVLKDLGGDKLKEEAEELYPELVEMRQKQVKQVIADQESRRRDAEEASKIYVGTVKTTLDKEVVGGIKLTKEDKAKLYEAVTQPKYTSLNGGPTNLFVKTLEELQFGKNANYDLFMNIVQFTIDPKGFTEKLKTSVGNELAEATFIKLKTSKTSVANTDASDAVNRSSTTNKKTIPKREGFNNPYA